MESPTFRNKRKSTRFVRDDIKASIVKISFLGLNENIDCQLIDISSTGAQVTTSKKIRLNAKLILVLHFDDGKRLQLQAKVVRHKEKRQYVSYHEFPSIESFLNDKELSLINLELFQLNKHLTAKYQELMYNKVRIMTDFPLKAKKQYRLVFTLSNGKKYRIDTQINDRRLRQNHDYAVKFNKPNDELGDQILETQTDLVFK